jgi:hypothetical protein
MLREQLTSNQPVPLVLALAELLRREHPTIRVGSWDYPPLNADFDFGAAESNSRWL